MNSRPPGHEPGHLPLIYPAMGGAGDRNRTYDLCVTSALLCLLSYVGIRWTSRIFAAGATPAFPGLCVYSIQLIQMFDDALNTVDGGNGRVRTPAPLAWPPGFQNRPLQPLGYVSKVPAAGVEPAIHRLQDDCFTIEPRRHEWARVRPFCLKI